MVEEKKQIAIPKILTVKALAEASQLPVTQVIRELLKNGVLASINDNIDFETAAIIADDLGFEVVSAKEEEGETLGPTQRMMSGEGELRAPVVVVMGHVDHGKTSLLDYIRKTKVVEGESGGITQHIGAYQVEYKNRKITFLDTPGHEAFSTIRAQGARVMDVAILVVAADEGIKPQTIEAIELVRAAKVPFVVAVTKMDKPEANIGRVEQELAAHEIVTEKWGGKDVIVGVSAKTGEGVDELLELVLLQADLAELRAEDTGPATGIVIETRHDHKVGCLVTFLVQQGTLNVGDSFVVGDKHGRIKSMEDANGKRIKSAGPSMPVQLTGFPSSPSVGEQLQVVGSEKEARQISTQRLKKTTARRVSVKTSDLSHLSSQIRAAHASNLNIVLKADVEGSLEAIKNQISQIKTDKGKINLVGEGLGNVAESDVLAAEGEKAFIVGFKVDVNAPARKLAKKDDIKILTYDVIYELTDDLTKILLESIQPEKVEMSVGKATVLKIFRDTRSEKIIGMKVVKGKAQKGDRVRFSRGEEFIGEGGIKSIKRLQEEVREASAGDDFGFQVAITDKIKPDDTAEFVHIEYKKVILS